MFTRNLAHVYQEFGSCLPGIWFMFTENLVHVYREINTFWQADSGPARSDLPGDCSGGGKHSDRRAVNSEGTGRE